LISKIIVQGIQYSTPPQPTHLHVSESCVAASDSLKLLGVTLNHNISSISTFQP